MDVESVQSGNSHRSLGKNSNIPNQKDPNSMGYSNYDPHFYGQVNNPTDNFQSPPYQNNIIPIYNPSYFSQNFSMPMQGYSSIPMNNNAVMFGGQYPNQSGYTPMAMFPNNEFGDVQSVDANTEKIQVQILPQDDNWGADTCTAVTSDTGGSAENISAFDQMGNHITSVVPRCDCIRIIGNCIFVILCIISVFSPVAMIVLPHLKPFEWRVEQCGPTCEGQLISMVTKLIILIIGTWALFFRRKQYSLTRISMFRALILFLAFAVVFSYWLFYSVRILDKKFGDFHSIVVFAVSLIDTLLFIHYLALILLEIYHLQTFYFIKVTRSPDGISKFYRVGRISVQSAAIFVLQNYVTDFPDYNYDLVQCLKRKCYKRHRAKQNSHSNTPEDTPDKRTKYKVYNIDGTDNPVETEAGQNHVGNQNGMKISTGTSARLYEEAEWDKKFRKRQMRLLVAVEEAFSHVHAHDDAMEFEGPTKSMSAHEAAQTILPAIIKPLQKLLRVSRRHLSYSSGIVIGHIAQSLSYRLSPKFLVQQFSPSLMVMDSLSLNSARSNEKIDKSPPLVTTSSQLHLSWTVVCNRLLSRGLDDGVFFQLKPRDCKIEDLCLMCTVQKVPFFSLEEKYMDAAKCRFTLQTNSETSV